jgi:hypothetical protein
MVKPKGPEANSVNSDPPPTLVADVGVVVVHGIGDHREGQTLVSFAEPMVDWLRDWLNGAGGAHAHGEVRIVESRLKALRNEAESPAYAVAEIAIPPGHDDRERWLLTEAWWGESVQPPASLRLMGWMLGRGPLLIYCHFFLGGSRRGLLNMVLGFTAFALAGLVQVVLILAMLLWAVPIGPWRRAVADLMRTLTLTLGDSYVLLEHDFQRAAMVERVWRTLRWLSPRVGKVAVVAHSQGGSVAHEALCRGGLEGVLLFASVGSGLEKLRFLHLVRDLREGVMPAALLAPLAAAGLPLLIAGLALGPEQRWLAAPGSMLTIGMLMCAIATISALEHYRRVLLEDLPRLDLRPSLGSAVEWLDLHATHDIVPMGKDSLLRDAPFVERQPVVNLRSYLHDHVRYFSNRHGVLPLLWRKLAKLSRLPMAPLVDDERMAGLRYLHSRHAWTPWWGIRATTIALLAGLWTFHSSLFEFGESIGAALSGAGLAKVLDPVRVVVSVPSRIAQRVGLLEADVPIGSLMSASLGAAALAVVGVLWWIVFRTCWHMADYARWRRICVASKAPKQRLALVFSLLWWFAASLPLVAVVLVSIAPEAVTATSLQRTIAAVPASLIAAIVLVFAGAGPMGMGDIVGSEADSLELRLLIPVGLFGLIVLLSAAAMWFWPRSLSTRWLLWTFTCVWVVLGAGWTIFAIVSRKYLGGWGGVGVVALLPLGVIATLTLGWPALLEAKTLGNVYGALLSLAVSATLAYKPLRNVLATLQSRRP